MYMLRTVKDKLCLRLTLKENNLNGPLPSRVETHLNLKARIRAQFLFISKQI